MPDDGDFNALQKNLHSLENDLFLESSKVYFMKELDFLTENSDYFYILLKNKNLRDFRKNSMEIYILKLQFITFYRNTKLFDITARCLLRRNVG